MHCPRCGHENEDDSGFCTNCGSTLLGDSVAEEKPSSRERLRSLIGTTRAARIATAGTGVLIVIAIVSFIALKSGDEIPRDSYTIAADGLCVDAKHKIATAGQHALESGGPSAGRTYAKELIPIVAEWRMGFNDLVPPQDRAEMAAALSDSLLQVLIQSGALARLPRQSPPGELVQQSERVDQASQSVESAIRLLGLDDCAHLSIGGATNPGD